MPTKENTEAAEVENVEAKEEKETPKPKKAQKPVPQNQENSSLKSELTELEKEKEDLKKELQEMRAVVAAQELKAQLITPENEEGQVTGGDGNDAAGVVGEATLPKPARKGMALAGLGQRRQVRPKSKEPVTPPNRHTAKVYPDKSVGTVDQTTFK